MAELQPEDKVPPDSCPGVEPAESSPAIVCRLCAAEKSDCVDIFGDSESSSGLSESAELCLPILITPNDDLSKSLCGSCVASLLATRQFFDRCLTANQQQIISLRKTRGSPLDLQTHLDQYVRSFLAPTVPQIKLEPVNFCDVDLETPDDYDENNENFDPYVAKLDDPYGGDIKPDLDGFDFKAPSNKAKRKRGRPRKNPDHPVAPPAKKTKRARKSKAKKKENLDDFVDDDDYGEDSEEDWGEEEEEEETKIKTEDGTVVKIPKKRKKKGPPPGRRRIVPLSLRACTLCTDEFVFSSHEDLLVHWKAKHESQEIVFRCKVDACQFTTKTEDAVYAHRVDHTKEAGIQTERCTICEGFYPPEYLYTRHLFREHPDATEFQCSNCEEAFKNPPDLRSHRKQAHPSKKDDLGQMCCELCGKRFTAQANLEAHVRIHSGYKPYACDFCGKAFSQKGNMEEHKRTHTGEKPYVCELCGSAFVRRTELVLHNRCAHTGERPYQCAYCPKNFQRRDLLRKHERIHTDTRPYSCQYCQKSFTQRDKMVVHTRLHTGERPYVCDVCGKGFCESGNLKKHLRVHGKEAPSVMHQNNKGKPAPVQSASSLQKQAQLAAASASAGSNQSNSAGGASSSSSAAANLDIPNLPLPLDIQSQFDQQQQQQQDQKPPLNLPSLESQQQQQQQLNNSGMQSQHQLLHHQQQQQQQQLQQQHLLQDGHMEARSSDSRSSYTPLSRQQLLPSTSLLQQHSHGAVPPQRPFSNADGGSSYGGGALRDDQSDTASERSVTPNNQSASSTPNLPYPAVHPLISHLRHWYEHAPGPPGGQHHHPGAGNNQ